MMQLQGVGKWKSAFSDINSKCETAQLNGLSSHVTINYEHNIFFLFWHSPTVFNFLITIRES